jgi:hypothetical protein
MKKLLTAVLIAYILVIVVFTLYQKRAPDTIRPIDPELISTKGVCPPFYLYDEDGNLINPIAGLNADKPYSPKQTCGKCHDYDKITQGFHFQQGKDEVPGEILTSRSQWVSHPGNYGGNWCSPAPLYSYLSPKENVDEKLIDMTSYTFINKCGVCHPGGGPLEYDRDNLRYDYVVADSMYQYADGGINQLDGDYYKAKWAASGVIEADCFLCHLPQYNNKERVKQIQKYNYRYAALAGSGLGKVSGSVADGVPVSVEYNAALFNPNGTIEPNIITEPRNSACLWCHAKPGYKKRGTDFTTRSDVHMRAGLKCVDCHVTGSMAFDKRIRGKEVHQFGKGDDPSGMVREDLDNTLRTCQDCHNTGYLGAPVAQHAWLPPLHLEKISCQACHIPERYVKSAHYVASDLFNPGTKIPDKGKYLWTFYGPDMNYWNHYGDLEMMGYEDKSTFAFEPELIRYKEQIFPVNRVHSSWPGIKIDGQESLMQPKMSDVFKMWTMHRSDASKYSELSFIRDDNNDSITEINRPEEIDALISALSRFLNDIDYPMDGKQVVWVLNDRVYTSGREYTEIPLMEWEVSAYGNVHKYSHDIKPAKSALGSTGCLDCHSTQSSFFFASSLKYPFDEAGNPVVESQYRNMGISGFQVYTGVFRESIVKPLLYFILFALTFLVLFDLLINRLVKDSIITGRQQKIILRLIPVVIISIGLFALFAVDLARFMFPTRIFLDANHFIFSAAVLMIGLYTFLIQKAQNKSLSGWGVLPILLLVAVISGILMLVKTDFFSLLTAISYTVYDLSLALILLVCIFQLQKSSFQDQSQNTIINN